MAGCSVYCVWIVDTYRPQGYLGVSGTASTTPGGQEAMHYAFSRSRRTFTDACLCDAYTWVWGLCDAHRRHE